MYDLNNLDKNNMKKINKGYFTWDAPNPFLDPQFKDKIRLVYVSAVTDIESPVAVIPSDSSEEFKRALFSACRHSYIIATNEATELLAKLNPPELKS